MSAIIAEYMDKKSCPATELKFREDMVSFNSFMAKIMLTTVDTAVSAIKI